MRAGFVAVFLALGAALAAQQTPRQVSLVVRNGTVITLDAAKRVIENGAVAIDGSDIVAVDTDDAIRRQFRGTETIDAGGQVIMPGLVNTHTHAPMVLLRGLADDLALQDWLNKYIFPAEGKLVSPEFVRVGTRLAALEMIESGTTTFADMYYFEEEIAKETKAAGLRGVLGQTVIQFPVADAKTPADSLVRAEAFIQQFKGDPLITPAVAPHAIYTLDGPTLKAARELSKRHGVPTIIHLAETRDEITDGARTLFDLAGDLPRQPRDPRSRTPGRARGVGERRGHRRAESARRRRVAQSREQHEARERRGAGDGLPPRGRGHRPWDRRRGEQQRSRHVRGHADGVVPGQAADHATRAP